MAAAMTERKHAELLNQVREMLVWRKWSTGQVSENKTLLEDSLEQLTVSQTLAEKRYDGGAWCMLVHLGTCWCMHGTLLVVFVTFRQHCEKTGITVVHCVCIDPSLCLDLFLDLFWMCEQQ